MRWTERGSSPSRPSGQDQATGHGSFPLLYPSPQMASQPSTQPLL
ncbi:unnamed protein product [Gulo gulo]|uniref:Uncharacterized protein n=1 Tax=Gulo gulo TaxID=48420 RepID=A0A9X9PSU1_GULGU|nr:unnamed protein product [Gulo gulo]